MTDLVLVLVAAGLTYMSRAAAVALLPPARGLILDLVRRIPAPLFAGLAVFALVGDELEMPEPAALAAVVGALLVSPKRSLGLTLAAGIGGFLVVELIS